LVVAEANKAAAARWSSRTLDVPLAQSRDPEHGQSDNPEG
jgi:hypothetical protein